MKAVSLQQKTQAMDYRQRKEERASRRSLDNIRDIGMGAFYLAIGSVVIYFRSFANITIPPAIAYILGGMMVAGGGFRLYRGIKAVLPHREDSGELPPNP